MCIFGLYSVAFLGGAQTWLKGHECSTCVRYVNNVLRKGHIDIVLLYYHLF